jgi:hypothetical protein
MRPDQPFGSRRAGGDPKNRRIPAEDEALSTRTRGFGVATFLLRLPGAHAVSDAFVKIDRVPFAGVRPDHSTLTV